MGNSRETRIKIAQETLKILDKGGYTYKGDAEINIKKELDFAISNSVLYKPDMLENIDEQVNHYNKISDTTVFEVTGETTLASAKRLVVEENIVNTACLNFASAKHPGGGFLTGSQAQEESLARASGLYPTIVQMDEMYQYNKSLKTCLYSDYMIFSPKVPVFRDDSDSLLEKPYFVSMITAPAVNTGIVSQREPENRDKIDLIMTERIKKILYLAIKHGNEAIVLGAFGCGVFRNKPQNVAQCFKNVLIGLDYQKYFKKIVFAVYDNSKNKENLNAFKVLFEGNK